jgi:hypothetical protein
MHDNKIKGYNDKVESISLGIETTDNYKDMLKFPKRSYFVGRDPQTGLIGHYSNQVN